MSSHLNIRDTQAALADKPARLPQHEGLHQKGDASDGMMPDRTTTAHHRVVRPLFAAYSAIAMLVIAAFALASHLALGSLAEAPVDTSLAQALLGQTRIMLSDRFHREADIYFHRGLDYKKPESALSGRFFARLHEQLEPSTHLHAESKSQIKEIMPWLELAMRLNPDDQEAALTAAYWLDRHLERPDLAEGVLNRAQQQIRFSYAVQLAKARLYLHQNSRDAALKALNAALAFWTHAANPENVHDRAIKAEALLFRGILLESKGSLQAAASDYRELLAVSPEQPGPHQRLQAIESGQTPHPAATDLLDRLATKRKHEITCAHDCTHE